jgi:SAM-dependent methyltransferase
VRVAALKALVAHPLTAGCDLDDPRTTARRRRIILEKPFLRRIYEEWYSDIAARLPVGSDPVLELGSGAGFLREWFDRRTRVGRVGKRIFASDVMPVSDLDLVADARHLPFQSGSLGALVMVNVLHHIADPITFFREAATVVRAGGRVVMIEPWVTRWSRFVYGRLHHEPFAPEAASWTMPDRGPLSGANSALPWIVFARDRARFENECPEWNIEAIELTMPFRYLVSGGVSLRNLMPAWTFPTWRWIEARLEREASHLAMFARIVLVRRGAAASGR